MGSRFTQDDTTLPECCPACRSRALSRQHVRSAYWNGERLVLVDGVPATVCEACGERTYDADAAAALDDMKCAGFPPARAARFLQVPIFDYRAPRPAKAQ